MTLPANVLFGNESFSTSETEQINKKLDEVEHDDISYRQGAGGVRLAYIEGWKVIKLANDIFGFNGWSTSILNTCTEFIDCENGRVSLGITCTARVTLKDGAFHEDVGFGSAENFKSKGTAFEKAKKEAVTDATKRALRHFGYALGLSTYDKEYLSDLTKAVANGNAKEREIFELSRNACQRQNPNPVTGTSNNQPQKNNAVNYLPNSASNLNGHKMEMVPASNNYAQQQAQERREIQYDKMKQNHPSNAQQQNQFTHGPLQNFPNPQQQNFPNPQPQQYTHAEQQIFPNLQPQQYPFLNPQQNPNANIHASNANIHPLNPNIHASNQPYFQPNNPAAVVPLKKPQNKLF
jgi:DNA repair and recombination protein RAD52